MLSVPPPTRVALGTLHIGGQRVELFVSAEWARYFQSLNSEVLASAGALAGTAQLTAMLVDGEGDAPDSFPAPPGQRGEKGEPGPALFMLQGDVDEQPMLMPPVIDGVFVPLNSKDASGGVPALTLLKLNLKNALGTITSWFTTSATAARTWTMPDKDGTVAVLSDFASPPAIGNTAPGAGTFTALTATGGFGCNGKPAQAAAVSGGTVAGVIAALVANGILSS